MPPPLRCPLGTSFGPCICPSVRFSVEDRIPDSNNRMHHYCDVTLCCMADIQRVANHRLVRWGGGEVGGWGCVRGLVGAAVTEASSIGRIFVGRIRTSIACVSICMKSVKLGQMFCQHLRACLGNGGRRRGRGGLGEKSIDNVCN